MPVTAGGGDAAPAEVMACVVARDLRDGELWALGAAAQVPMAAIKMARMTHAPNSVWMCGGSGATNSALPTLLDSAADYRNLFGAEYRTSMEDVVDCVMRGRADAVFFGGLQVDRFGSINLVCVGDYEAPSVRGPGSVGLPLSGAFGRVYIYVRRHDPRVLVERVDFVSGAGHVPGRDGWAVPTSRGPHLLVTPLAVFDFATATGEARLVSVHRGVTVDEALARTGFAPRLADPVVETEPPGADEIRLLRERIDRDGVLRRPVDG